MYIHWSWVEGCGPLMVDAVGVCWWAELSWRIAECRGCIEVYVYVCVAQKCVSLVAKVVVVRKTVGGAYLLCYLQLWGWFVLLLY